MMTRIVLAIVLGICMSAAFAADARDGSESGMKQKSSEKPNVGWQQDRTKICDKEATDKNLQGGERKTFMTSCMKGGNRAAQ
jgi:Ni/Co efflux regulator RcnB